MTEGIHVVVNKAEGLKCARCWKVNTEVDKDTMFAMTCPRCASVMHTIHYDIKHGATHLLPVGMREVTLEDFEERFVRK